MGEWGKIGGGAGKSMNPFHFLKKHQNRCTLIVNDEGSDDVTNEVILCVRNLMKDLANMSGLSLAHWVTTHLSALFYTVMPLLTTVNRYLE